MNKIDDRLPFGNPITIVVIYVMISIVLIIFSDVVLSTIAKDVPTLTMLQSFKGMIYIIINAIIIYILVNRGFRSISESNEYIKENERKHNIILDTVGDIIVYVDKYGKIIDVNKRVEIKLGYKKDELLGKSFIDVGILDVKYMPVMAKMFRQGIDNKMGGKAELELKHKDGSTIVVEANNKFIFQNGEVVGAVTAFRDITERKKALVQIENNIEHFAHLIDHIRNPLAILSTFTQVKITDKDIKNKLLVQIERIDEIIKQLDEGWMDTEDTRKFLKDYK
ncbi:MAG: sensory histidine kinase AtoS [Candidatus Methanofastidiosum methylothiophilum]|uniref:Sensory histidine kinase AtoS n=1 Tax=Candidatus Methanofastidiosum methylothiophilum TaxID=1705564 RepID=A0A150J7S9_9EURY|nr:MAG: sensory histidine kinase AtoS [Candidatus Methanofastidiosum methylthiophilus]NMC77364.1 PAS domain S-box protein [Candidatus Methanofastidiosa archaeon]